VVERSGPIAAQGCGDGLSRRLRFAALMVVALACLASAPAALAGEATVSGSTLTYTDTAPAGVNTVTISLGGANYTIRDTGAGEAPVPVSPCTSVNATTVSCPAAGVTLVEVNVGGGSDTVTLSPPANPVPTNASLLGGPGVDILIGGTGNDFIDGGAGDDRNDDFQIGLNGGAGDDTIYQGTALDGSDIIDGGTGGDTVSYEDRTNPLTVDVSETGLNGGGEDIGGIPGAETDTIRNAENFVGGSADDVLIGNQFGNRLTGGQGADVLCGGTGADTVDYSDHPDGVSVNLNGTSGVDTNVQLANIRQDCKAITANEKAGAFLGKYDCVADDGSAYDAGVVAGGDCVGDDVDNVLGTPFNDVLIGSDPDPSLNVEPRIEPRGPNRLMGGGGDDTLDGLLGADVFEGGDGSDTVTYAGRTLPVTATIDGVADDGTTVAGDDGRLSDFDSFRQRHDSIGLDVENVIGGSAGDTFRGDADANLLVGGEGGDSINGGAGGDTLLGGGGGERK